MGLKSTTGRTKGAAYIGTRKVTNKGVLYAQSESKDDSKEDSDNNKGN